LISIFLFHGWNTLPESLNDPPLMSHATNSTPPDDNIDIHAVIRQMQNCIQQQQDRIQQLEAATSEQDGRVVFKTSRATTLKLYDELLEVYPAISEPNFYDAELPKDHEVFDWNDFHYTDGMEYKAPPVLEHTEVSLSGPAKRHEAELAAIQGYMANSTRFYDTCAHEIVNSGEASSKIGKRMLSFLNTIRISAANDASKISRLRENLYYDALGIKHGNNKERSLLTLESLAATKAAADMVRKTYKKPEPPKDKTKKPDNKYGKDKSRTGDKPKDQQSGKSQSNGKSGYKSDGGKSGGKHWNKSSGGSGKKQPDQGNDGEKSE